jgi:hypothetical protein
MPKQKIGLRLDPATTKFLESTFPGMYQGGNLVLDAFPILFNRTIQEMNGKFTKNELSFILDLSNGSIPTAQILGQTLGRSVLDAAQMEKLDKKWEVDASQLAKKIKKLTAFQAACLELWAYGFWSGGNREYEISKKNIDDKIEELL